MVGLLYDVEDIRHLRATGFSIFYAGINIGALIATFLVGYVGEVIGWHFAFSLAAFGMALSLVLLNYGKKYLPASTNIISPKVYKKIAIINLSYGHLVILGAVIMAFFFAVLIPYPIYSSYVISLSSIILFIYLFIMMLKVSTKARKQIALILFMSLFVLFFGL